MKKYIPTTIFYRCKDKPKKIHLLIVKNLIRNINIIKTTNIQSAIKLMSCQNKVYKSWLIYRNIYYKY